MAEAIGIAATVIQTASLASKVQALLASDFDSLKARPPQLVGLENELVLFRTVLDILVEFIVREDRELMSRQCTHNVEIMLQTTSEDLQRLANVLQKLSQKNGRRLKGSMALFARKEIENIRQHLEAQKDSLLQTIQILGFARQTQVQTGESRQALSETDTSAPAESGETATTPDIVQTDEEILVSDYLQRLGHKQKNYFSKFTFDKRPAFLIRTNGNTDGNNDNTPQVEPFDHGIKGTFSAVRAKQPISSLAKDPEEMILILCEATTATSNDIPFSQEAFVQIMERLSIPQGLFQALFTGTPKFVFHRVLDDRRRAGLVLRNPMSITENWTLALSWDSEYRDVSGIIHGIESRDMSRLATYIGDTRELTAHPMNIPVILCEMLVESDSNSVKLHALKLHQVEKRTNFHGYTPSKYTNGNGNLAKQPEQDFAELTQSLNLIISRLAFHEMRILANSVNVDEMKQLFKSYWIPHQQITFTGNEQEKKKASLMWSIHDRLVHLKTEQRALLLEITCNQKIAQSQLEIVYNLVAQRDNKDNLEMATTQTDIANTTKEDSFAMRTIAVMSIAFLPGTFVSSFFSMDMFNWQAPKGASVLSSRFWIYWAITIPLTLMVFSFWFFWLRNHHKRESQRHKPSTLVRSRSLPGEPEVIEVSKQQPWYRNRWTRVVHKDEEKQPIEDVQPRHSFIATTTHSALRSRVLTASIERSDTVLHGPAR